MPARSSRFRHAVADITALVWLAFAVGLAATLTAWYFTEREASAYAELRFKSEADDACEAIERRMEGYVSMLRGAAAFFNATGAVSGSQWQRYVADLQIGTDWPGIQTTGYIEMVAAAKEVNRQSRIVYLEPASAGTVQIFAFDPFAEPVRRAAMELARDSGAPAVSARIAMLMSATGPGQTGFLIFVPVYASGALPQTLEQRRSALRGFVFGVFSIPDMMVGVLGEASQRIDFRVFDEASVRSEALIYDSHTTPDLRPPRYTRFSRISLPGRSWTLETHGRPQFESSLISGMPTAVAVGGTLANLLFFGLLVMLLRNKASSAQLSKLSQALEQSPESVVITDIEGRIEYVNDAFVRSTGYARNEVIGTNPRILQSGKTPRETYVAMWASLGQGLPWKGEFINRSRDGIDYVEIAIIVPLRQPGGEIAHYVAVKQDITEIRKMSDELDFHRRHLEEQVIQRTGDLIDARQQADDANEAKSRFLAAMSHEIRTPLNAVLGFAYLCLNRDLGACERSYLEKIHSAAGSLVGLVNDILDFSKADAGKLQLEAIPFSLAEVLQRVAELFQLATRSKGVELVIGTLPGVPDNLVGDPFRLGQVLINLVGNAVKFTEQGEIHLTVEPLTPGAETLTLRFVVRDTGPGMSKQQLALLFTPFVQADSTITRKFGGTGLGLALCKQLVARMDGQIDVDSEEGVGSCFSFSATFGRTASTADPQRQQLAGRQVLVVDNSATMRTLLCHNVTSFGCEVDAVDCGEAALACIEAGERFDLILMDWHMPGRDGLATARDIRSAGSAVPILLISGDEAELARAAAREVGVAIDAFLCKPVSAASLHMAMVSALASLAHKPDQPPDAGPLPPPRLAGKRILLVDDNDFNRQIGRELVELTGAYVATADDGAQAVAAVAEGDYDLVLMDIQMPVMDGHCAARIIRDVWPTLPIIALTAHAMHEEKARIMASGMNDLLTKPIMPGVLYATLGHWLGGGRLRGAGGHGPLPGAQIPASAEPAPALAGAAGGFDEDAALSRVNGDRALLDRFLRLFRERNASVVDDIGESLIAQDGDSVRRLVHTLKGSAGTVGLIDLQVAAQRLESSLEQTLDASADYAQLQTAWQRAMETLAAMLDGP